MKKVLALTAGVLVALAPTGTAFAEEVELRNVPGKAYGNCGHSSQGGSPHTGIVAPDRLSNKNRGNGGLADITKAESFSEAVGCKAVTTTDTPSDPSAPVDPPQPLPGYGDLGM